MPDKQADRGHRRLERAEDDPHAQPRPAVNPSDADADRRRQIRQAEGDSHEKQRGDHYLTLANITPCYRRHRGRF
jgi:hypothetical protein